ncbi:MAG TPA: hypothetical protein PLQ65_16555, partial [Flavihumibacter sp.]|nr:hypothetical protein [Flavihumibacter sp.]
LRLSAALAYYFLLRSLTTFCFVSLRLFSEQTIGEITVFSIGQSALFCFIEAGQPVPTDKPLTSHHRYPRSNRTTVS